MPAPSPLAEPFGNLPKIADLHAVLRDLRTHEPVAWCGPRQCWIVTSHEFVTAALEDPRLSNRRTSMLVRAQLGENRAHLAADFERVISRMMLMNDGDAHHRLRTLGHKGLTPRVLERARLGMEHIANKLLDRCLAKKHFDLVADFSQPYPARIIATLFDLPEHEIDLFQEPSEALARFFGATMRNPEADALEANRATLLLEKFFLELLAQRKKSPADDLMSLFLKGQDEHQLTDDEVCAQCIVLLAGGHVTTKGQIANAVHALLSSPQLYRELCAHPELAEKAGDESLRYDGALSFVMRLATENMELGGRSISQGEIVFLGLSAANRDPRAFENPDQFDLHRASQRHLAFGQGPHYCIGSGLSRLELEVALTAISQRMPNLQLDAQRPPEPWCDSMVFRGFESLPLVC